MVAQNWVNTLHARLTTCPSVSGTACYLVLLTAVCMVSICLTIVIRVAELVVWIATFLVKVIFAALLNPPSYSNHDGWREGDEGFGEYRGGIFQATTRKVDE